MLTRRIDARFLITLLASRGRVDILQVITPADSAERRSVTTKCKAHKDPDTREIEVLEKSTSVVQTADNGLDRVVCG
jgi:hypothetical protein